MNLLAAEQRGIVTLHPPHIEKISPQRSGEFNPKRLNFIYAPNEQLVLALSKDKLPCSRAGKYDLNYGFFGGRSPVTHI
jgi:hypothetical protein